MATSIEYTTSAILGKNIIRTAGIELKGRGIKQHHSTKEGAAYNVYVVTGLAFDKITTQHPEMGFYN